MNLFARIGSEIAGVIEALVREGKLPEGLDISRITVEPPRDPSHGDMATNAAMILCKQAGMNPRQLAELLAGRIGSIANIASVEVAGPGFINIRLGNGIWLECLKAILEAGETYGASDIGNGLKVNVEYVSANPTGPLHIGHARGAVVGDALARLLAKAGYDVTKEYYVNDAGSQVDTLGRSAFIRYREALGEDVGEIPEGLYPGEYLKAVGEALKQEFGTSLRDRPEEEWLPVVRPFTVERMLERIRDDLEELGIHHDVFSSERRLVEEGKVDAALETLTDKGLIYTGVLEPPKGKKPEDWEPRPQTLFKATEFGDDVDRPLKKSDGSWTYFASDIAYHLDKFRRGNKVLINIWGADHAGYVKRMQAATRAVTGGEATLDVKICQMVKLLDKGEPIKMSKRAGTFVTLRDLVDEVGRDVVRFFLLTRKNDAPLDFDLTAVTEQSRDNPVFYVHYAHARCCSVLNMAKEAFPSLDLSEEALVGADLSLLSEAEVDLVKSMANWPRFVEAAAEAHEPHRIAFYLYELASQFHSLWTKGREDSQLRFVVSDDEKLTRAKMALVVAVKSVIASGLKIFGVEPRSELH